jgi:hypothetical protein
MGMHLGRACEKTLSLLVITFLTGISVLTAQEIPSNSSTQRFLAVTRSLNAKIDSLEEVISDLTIENQRLQNELNSVENLQLSSVTSAYEERLPEQTSSKPKSSYGEYSECVEAASYQPLFSEKIVVYYEPEPDGTFSGKFDYSYAPEFGQRESREQRISGTYAENDGNYVLKISLLDGRQTNLILTIHQRSYKSSFKAGPGATALPYTKVVHFEDLSVYRCLF